MSEEGNISVQIHHLRRTLRDSARPHRWIATVPGRGYRFIGRLEAAPNVPDDGLAPILAAPANNLPATPPRYHRAEKELAALQAAMPRHRLVTVTGPGGMGKTRLALEFAREHAADPLNKILFLGLEGLRQKDQIMFRLAAGLGVQPTEGPNLAQALADALQKQGYFLVFDNCEHVLNEVAALVEIILERTRGVSILATSREALKLGGELVFTLGPLEFPGHAKPLGSSEIKTYAAVQLFVENARASDPAFKLSDDIALDVAAICRKMEGIPLALELAAARLHTASLAELLDGNFRATPPAAICLAGRSGSPTHGGSHHRLERRAAFRRGTDGVAPARHFLRRLYGGRRRGRDRGRYDRARRCDAASDQPVGQVAVGQVDHPELFEPLPAA